MQSLRAICQRSNHTISIMTSRHQSAREETRENKESLKIAMFDLQEYRQDKPQGLKKKKHLKN